MTRLQRIWAGMIVIAVALVAAGVVALLGAPPAPRETRAQLAALLEAGKLSAAQATLLARVSEAGALPGNAERAARAAYRDAAPMLFVNPDTQVRRAALALSQ